MTREMLLKSYLKSLRLPVVARQYEPLAREAEDQNRTYAEYLTALVEQEVLQRQENQLQKRLKWSRFPVPKTLETFDFAALPALNKPKVLGLTQGDFIRQKENVILVGNPGTGKTHLATAIGASACRQGYRVRFCTAAGLVNELLMAQQEYRLAKVEQGYLRTDLVILDELGYLPFSQTGAQLLFQFCSSRYERGSLLITTNLEFTRWTEVFGDEKLAAALLDRLTHRAHILVMNGDSYRFKESLRRQEGA